MAVFVGIYDDHNSGFAAVTEDGVVLYSEFERMTRAKNQAGWHPDLVADCLNTIGLEDLAAITAPDVSKVAGLLAERYEAEIINGDAVVLWRSADTVTAPGGPASDLSRIGLHHHPARRAWGVHSGGIRRRTAAVHLDRPA